MEHANPVTENINSLYSVEHTDNNGVFGIKVTRKSTGTVVFDTSVGRMSFYAQFMQISTKLPSTYIYGFGEHMHETFKHDVNWKTYGMFSRDQGVGPNANLYGVHPYYQCMEEDGNAHGVFFVNSNAMDVTLQPTPALTYRTIGGILDFYVFLGPSPEEVTQQYTNVIGRSMFPPYWSLGFQLCKYGYGSLDNLKQVVDRNLAAGIPYDVQYTDIDYMDRQLDFTINATTYNGLEDYIVDLKNNHNLRYIIIFDPAISGNETDPYPPFSTGVEQDVFIKDTKGEIAWGKVWPDLPGVYVNTSKDWAFQTENYRAFTAFPDFFKSSTEAWWTNHTVEFHKRLKFDGLWIDMNEPASFVHGTPSNACPASIYDDDIPYHPHILGDKIYDKTTCMQNMQHHPVTGEKTPHYNVHSLYGYSQALPTLKACQASTGERCIVFSRSTYPGSGKYSGHWLGDNTSMWEHLAASIIGMMEFNLFGIPYVGADICGFFSDTTNELCMRWMQLGAFYPFSRNHNGLGSMHQDPAYFGPEFAEASKKVLEVRYRLLPFLYTLFFKAHVSGSTVVRPLMNEFPQDITTYTIDKQFLWGNALLFTPVLHQGVDYVEGYIPKARWFDYYSGREIPASIQGGMHSFHAPLDSIPIHVRGGTIIPVQDPGQTTSVSRMNDFGLIYALPEDDSEITGKLFWDDGTAINTIENEEYSLAVFHGLKNRLWVTFEHGQTHNSASSLNLGHVEILGLETNDVLRVLVNDVEHDDYQFDNTNKKLTVSNINILLMSDWSISWDANDYDIIKRFDCYPESFDTVSQEKCEARGCMYVETYITGAPWCYFPDDYVSYKKATWPQQILGGEEFQLRKVETTNFFSAGIINLTVQVLKYSANQLRIKIFDKNSARYEVPLEISGQDSGKFDPLYEVIYEDEPFAVKVIRKSTREVVFDTSVGVLKFENQFLQLSTRLPTENVYGFGEHEHTTYKHDFNWKTYGMFTRDILVNPDRNLYGHHPYYTVMEDSGLSHGVLFLNSNAMEVAFTPLPSLTFRTIGGILDFNFFFGPTPENVVQQYTNAIGRPVMPAYWALGFQLCRWGYANLSEVQEVVEGMIDHDIPQDVQYGDIDYMERQLDFTLDETNFKDLPDYVDKMRNEYNMRYVIILDHVISTEEPNYPPYTNGNASDVFVKNLNGENLIGKLWPENKNSSVVNSADVVFADFFNPATHDWWKNEVKTFYNNTLKFDGLWIDMNEPSNFVEGSIEGCPDNEWDNPPYIPNLSFRKLINPQIYEQTICMSSRQYKDVGSTELHYNVHSLYGWSQAQPTLEACQETTGERCYVISRSTYPGASQYVGHWHGDNTSIWRHLKASIIAMFEWSSFGFPYTGADICGFNGNAEREMCMRWMQLGAFYPFSRNHNARNFKRQDPVAWDDSFADASRTVLQTRYTLLPYLYTLFYHANNEGSTVVRPLMHEFPLDKITVEIDSQFLWGASLLITPVLEEGVDTVEGYFPDARWYSYYSGIELPVRGSFYSLSAAWDFINLHVRGGAIIPTQQPARTTFESRLNSFGLIVALDDNSAASGNLFWDDGVQIKFDDWFYAEFSFATNELTSTIINDNLANSTDMMLEEVFIFGWEGNVGEIFVNDDKISTFESDYVTKKLRIYSLNLMLNEPFTISIYNENDRSRIDCWPDLNTAGDELNKNSCEKRGCIWLPSTTNTVPSCYFPSDQTMLPGYEKQTTKTTRANAAVLTQVRATQFYDTPVENLQFNMFYEEDNRFHFKLTDADNPRFEIPTRFSNFPTGENSDELSSNYQVQVNYNPFNLKILRNSTGRVLFDTSVGPLIYEDQFLQISTALPSSCVFGLGEHNHRQYRHNLNRKRWAIFTRDVAPVDEWNLYGHQTFWMALDGDGSGKAFGVYLHNANAMDVTLDPELLTYRVTGGVLDFYVFIGNSQEEVVQEYHALVGKPIMPPYWGLGFQLSRWDYGSLDRVKEVVKDMRDAQMPFDIQYGDIDYMENKKSFTYDHDLYSGLPEFVDDIHSYGMKYVVILDPGIKIEDGYKAYDEGIDARIFVTEEDGTTPLVTEVWPGETHHPDFTHPSSYDWWYNQTDDFYSTQNIKVDALWIDMNEPANFQTDNPVKLAQMNCTGRYNIPPYMPKILNYEIGLHMKTYCMDKLHYNNTLHYNVHSLYGHTMSMVTYDTAQRLFPDKRSFVMTRSNFAGTGKYATHWLGDNQSQWRQMPWAIPAMLEYNLFGMPWVGADICGFWYNTTAEMCQRWMQVGAFYPFSRNHNAATMIPQHPTVFGESVTQSSKEVLEIRYSILPYIYTLFQDVHANGGTVIRALVHEFPEDQNTWNLDRQFLVGSSFLVTAVMEEGKTSVTGYFPYGARWFDFRTGIEVDLLGRFISLAAPLDYINLHVRGGIVIPMQEPNVTTTISRTKPISLLVALDNNYQATGSLYWDDGEMREVGNKFIELSFQANATMLEITVSHHLLEEFTSTLFFNQITVYGLDRSNYDIGGISSGMEPSGVYNYENDGETLKITELQLPIIESNKILFYV